MLGKQPQPAASEGREARVGRALDDYLQRRAHGGAVDRAAFLAEHPDLADDLADHLELLGELRPSAGRIDDLISRGLLSAGDDPRCSAKLGKYEILDYLGRGGMGIVLKARDPELDRIVAVKILRPDLADDPAIVARFTREAKAAAALKHPNIVTVHSVGVNNGAHLIAMEYVAGPTLRETIHDTIRAAGLSPHSAIRAAGFSPRGSGVSETAETARAEARGSSLLSLDPRGALTSLDTATIRETFRQLLSALAAAHDAGLIHRDVKSSNILLELPRIRTRSVSEGPAIRPRSVSDGPSNEASIRFVTDTARGRAADFSPRGSDLSKMSEAARAEARGSSSEPQTLNPEPSLTVKLADFGLARLASSQTALTTADSILGTPEYMSPEQARGDADLDHRTDLYSAGVVLYEMLTGRVPFKADTPTAVLHQITHIEPPDPRSINKSVDPALASLAMRLMAKEPDDRLESAEAALEVCESAATVRIPEHARRRRRRLIVPAIVLVLAAMSWAIGRFNDQGRMITGWRIDPETNLAIQVRRGNNLQWELFHRFPPGIFRLDDVEAVDTDGDGQDLIVVGLYRPDEGANIVAFDLSGKRVWGLYLRDETKRCWPDCDAPIEWSCYDIAVGDLDGKPGDELVVVVGELREYSTRVSIVDPRTGSVRPRSTFWNFGNINDVRVEPDFFDDGGPAIIAWGPNNKLDGFDTPGPGDDKPVAHWDYVYFVAVLDPDDMNGLGPPRTKRKELADISIARPYAYAFLDLPQTKGLAYRSLDGQPSNIRAQGAQVAGIVDVRVEREDAGQGGARSLVAYINREQSEVGGVIMKVDRHLNFISAVPANTEKAGADPEYWRERWRPIIRDGRYVTDH